MENSKRPRPPTDQCPIAFPQLCAVSLAQVEPDPTIGDAEWKARIKDRLVALGFVIPRPDQLSAAMDAVERGLVKRGVCRLVRSEPARAPEPSDVTPLSHAEASAILMSLGVRLGAKTMPRVQPRSLRAMECHAASKVVAAAIMDSIQTCEALERAAAEAEKSRE